MSRNVIVALVGPSGAGKTALIERAVRIFPDRYDFLPGFLTRPLRPGEEQFNLEAVSKEEALSRYRQGSCIQMNESAGNLYGNEFAVVDELLHRKIALKDLLPQGVQDFRRAGYRVDVILVHPVGHTPRAGRRETDAELAKSYTTLGAKLEIINDHTAPHGLQLAFEQFLTYIEHVSLVTRL